MINIGNTLKEHRTACGYTQSALAKATDIKQQNISRWESNMHNPDIMDCIKLANFYGITLDELVGVSDNFGTPTASAMHDTASYSSEERELIKKYRELNAPGKKLVKTVIDTQLATMAESGKNKNKIS